MVSAHYGNRSDQCKARFENLGWEIFSQEFIWILRMGRLVVNLDSLAGNNPGPNPAREPKAPPPLAKNSSGSPFHLFSLVIG